MEKELIFYDLISNHPQKFWSPHCLKSRFLLNLLKIEYKTEWVNFEELLPKFSALGVPPNDFYPTYWLPTIQLPDGTFICSSENILEHYLRNRASDIYPDKEYQRFSEKFVEWFEIDATDRIGGFLKFVALPFMELILPTRGGRQYYRETKGTVVSDTDLESLRNDSTAIEMYQIEAYDFLMNMREEFPSYRGFDSDRFMKGKFLYGDRITYGDIVFASIVFSLTQASETVPKPFFDYKRLHPWIQQWYKNMKQELYR